MNRKLHEINAHFIYVTSSFEIESYAKQKPSNIVVSHDNILLHPLNDAKLYNNCMLCM